MTLKIDVNIKQLLSFNLSIKINLKNLKKKI